MPDYNTYYKKFMAAIGREDLVESDKYFPVQSLQANKLGTEVYDIVMEAINKKDMEYWRTVFTEADIPFALAQNWMEIRNDKQAEANNCFYDMTYENGNTRRLVRLPVKFTEMGVPDYKRGPLIGENGREVLKEIGYSDSDVDKLIDTNALYIWEKK
jgi:cinnamoyl-coA:phenyllactate coA-transferase